MSANRLSPEQTLAVARLVTRKHLPYLSSAVMALIPRATPGLGTCGVTETGVMHWDPEWCQKIGPDQLAGVLLHEALHIVMGHAPRARAINAEHELWNIAADLEINDDLRTARVPLPVGGIYPTDPEFGLEEGGAAESYYATLRQREAAGQSVPRPDKPTACGGWDGSGGGRAIPGEDPSDGTAQGTEALVPGRSEADLQRVRNQVATAIQEYEKAKGQGSVPGRHRAWANQHMQPAKIRWQDKLRRAIRGGVACQAGMVDYTYQAPSRRQAMYAGADGSIILPGLRAPMPRVAIGLDTSGSMNGAPLEQAASEIDAILRTLRASVEFIAGDAKVQFSGKLKSCKEFGAKFLGGGGTSFVPIFDHLRHMRSRPPLFIFLTDAEGDAPSSPPPGVKIIWVVINSHAVRPRDTNTGEPVTWGQFIHIDPFS